MADESVQLQLVVQEAPVGISVANFPSRSIQVLRVVGTERLIFIKGIFWGEENLLSSRSAIGAGLPQV